jgi:Cu2+-exporting ATPase
MLEGLHCSGCVHRTERALREAPGVREADVNYTTHRALVEYDETRTDPDALAAVVADLGYEAIPYDPEAADRGGERGAREMLARLLVAAFLALNVMMISVALYIGGYQDLSPELRRFLRWVAIGLSVPAVTWCALPFWRGAASGLRRLEITMDVPVVLGVSIAFAVSVVGTLFETDHLYMDSASMIVFLILLGRTLERRARARASSAVDRLATLTPRTALRRGESGLEPVPVESLRPGDRIVVPPGERVPTDGVVISGATELDESLLTGESQPVLRGPADTVVGGSRNVLAEVEVEVRCPVNEGTLARIGELLERAQLQRPAIQQTADRVAAVFAPSVIGVAALVAVGWSLAGAGAFQVALTTAAVLIVACPCALGLATPAAITAAIGRAASLGILVKSGQALERCTKADHVMLDKTGTLTEGRLVVEEIATAGVDPDALLAVAAAAEGRSTHPVAQALRREAERRGVAIDEDPDISRRAVPGRGVAAGDATRQSLVGARSLLDEYAVEIPTELEQAATKLAARGLTLAWVARGGRSLGVVGLADPPRADGAAAVARLRELGLSVSLVSGDHLPAVERAAERAGIRDFAAGCDPEEKVARVTEHRRAGRGVLAVGDGINDAAALAAADLGIAMLRGADVTLHAADLVIRVPRLGAVADAVALSRATLRRIRENLGFAVAYNALAIPLAALGFLPPLHAAIAMSLSSLLVTGNAARLLGWTSGAGVDGARSESEARADSDSDLRAGHRHEPVPGHGRAS